MNYVILTGNSVTLFSKKFLTLLLINSFQFTISLQNRESFLF